MHSEATSLETTGTALTIAVVGGLDRAAPALRELASLHGHRLEHHCGSSSGPGKRSLESIIGRADVVVIVTGHNSHPAVLFARERARHHGVPSLICRRFGPANLGRLLEALARKGTPRTIAPARDAGGVS
jgi:hypothetical protein